MSLKNKSIVNYRNKLTFANVLYHKLLVCGVGEVSILIQHCSLFYASSSLNTRHFTSQKS